MKLIFLDPLPEGVIKSRKKRKHRQRKAYTSRSVSTPKRYNTPNFYHFLKSKKEINRKNHVIYCPASLSFTKNEETTFLFLQLIQEHINKNSFAYKINFSNLEQISPEVWLYLGAKLYQMIEFHKYRWGNIGQRYINKDAFSKVSYEAFRDSGFFKFLPYTISEDTIKVNQNYFDFYSLQEDNSDDIENLIKKVADGDVLLEYIYRMFSEMIGNSTEYAYLNKNIYIPSMYNRWFIYGFKSDNNIGNKIVVLDLGNGIVESFTKHSNGIVNDIKRLYKRERHNAEIIMEALKLGESGSKKIERGQGFEDARQAANFTNGTLRVISDNAIITYDSANKKYNTFILNHRIEGTIISLTFDN